ncbi:condensin-2 complex subunit H2 [Salmo salar]|uniref:Condensin-2 complex subunit H2 n=1 Tax=Salmo salar TaxID=8030 RepID=A0A1S3N0V1_SALSA|nr:condensin-2 complex subunit H2-like [Salmo salar]XP_045555758.1 condensin-2 complex subunit H2-like [Salmo salar]|eukprot:XP_014008619.1 PREDICTED: condensin-2 complex subunit H2-like isoform X1 [Salmo salar]
MDTVETRFTHLLQPIRELTKNWDIDVASELADYLEELDEMCISFDGGKTTLNFAEAALLIQGSACIYSKKVEHLYNLVYQTLDYINDRNKKKDKQAVTSGEDGTDGASSNNANEDDGGFDSLDQDTTDVSLQSEMKNEANTNVDVAPLPPESLIPPEAFEKQKLLLISQKGEVLGSCKDFRMNTFTSDALGIIRLFLASSQSHFLRDALSDAPLAPVTLFGHQDDAELASGDAMLGVAGDDGGDADEENFLPLEDNGMEMDQGPEKHIDRHQAPSDGRVLRERGGVQQLSEEEQKKQRKEERAQTANMWMLHDLYDTVGEDKPLKTGRCYKVPPGLDDSGKRKRKGPSALQDFWTWYTGTYDPREPRLKNGPTYTDLNYIYMSKMKEKLKTRKRILGKTGVFVSDEELRTYLQLEEREEELEDLRHHDLLGLLDDLSDNEHDPLTDEAPGDFLSGQDFVPGADMDGLSYEDLVKKSVEQFLVNSQGYAQETALSKRVKEWEDKIRPELTYQEVRATFDIHDYGDRIVAALSSVGQRRTFSSIVHSMDNFEACKYMLASLQLANDYTVEIDRSEGLEESIDTMGLTLLSKHRANHRFKKAPAASFDPI